MQMKKFILTLATAIATVATGWAAEPTLGVRAGLDINSLTGDGFKNSCGYNVGAIYRMPLMINDIQGLYLEPGLFIYKDRWGVDKKAWMLSDANVLDKVNSVFFSTWGLRIPVMGGWSYDVNNDWKLMAFTGPELSIGFKNKFHANGRINGGDANLTWNAYGDDGTAHRADLAWKFGIGAEYQNWHLDIAGAVGLTYALRDVMENSHLNRVSITLGYNFQL